MNLTRLAGIPKAVVSGYLLSRRSWECPARLQELQIKALKKNVTTAYYQTTFFKEKYDAHGVHPDDIKSIEDLSKLPITTKKELMDNLEEALPKSLNKKAALFMGTSGTTGQPIDIYKDFKWVAHLFSYFLFLLKLHKMKSIKAAFIADINSHSTIEHRAHGFLKLFARKAVILPVEKDLVKIMKQLENEDVNYIATYPGVMRELATLKKNGMGKNLNISKIGLAGEMLDDCTREHIEEAFDCTCYSSYISTEGGPIAIECEHKNMHVNSGSVIVEVVDQNGRLVPKGEDGRILVTCIDGGSGTPIIRYDGCADIGQMHPEICDCGLSTPIMAPIKGRVVDTIHLPDGRIYHAFAMTVPLWEIQKEHGTDFIRQYQIVQHELDKITISFIRNSEKVKPEDSLSQLMEIIKNRYQKKLGEDVEISVLEVDELPRGVNSEMPAPLVLSTIGKKITENCN